jgi:arabinan endo-1,5-alpha-L-arabinosidase
MSKFCVIFLSALFLFLSGLSAFAEEVTIFDFESGDLANWKIISGNLKKQPAAPTRAGIRYGQQGQYFIGTTESGGENRGDYDDKLVGELHSKPFKVEKNFISFLIGGGYNEDFLFIGLVRESDKKMLLKATGTDSEMMFRKYLDVSDYLGETCYIRLVDNFEDTWGHLNVDDIRACDTRPDEAGINLVMAGDFDRIYNPSIGEKESWYINDHCFIMGKDGTWHMFGITHADPARAWDEDNFAHATSKNLAEFTWEKQPFALSTVADPWKEEHLWAPHVIYHKNKYYMFYCAGDQDRTKYKIHLAVSDDLWKWERHPENPMFVDGVDARDPCIIRVGRKWVLYYTANSEPDGGNHIVAYRTSKDLINWSARKTAFTDPSIGKGGGPTESPFVVQRGEYYYLFIGPRGGYVGTDVFQSKDPFNWNLEDKVGHIMSHAAEVIRDSDGKWYVSHCGWGKGGVYLAPLFWNDGVDKVETTLPVPKRK